MALSPPEARGRQRKDAASLAAKRDLDSLHARAAMTDNLENRMLALASRWRPDPSRAPALVTLLRALLSAAHTSGIASSRSFRARRRPKEILQPNWPRSGIGTLRQRNAPSVFPEEMEA